MGSLQMNSRSRRSWQEVCRAIKYVGHLLSLDNGWLTAVYWLTVAALCAGFFLCPCPPMIDYPHHVAMGAILHDLWISDPLATSMYVQSLFTYNGGSEVLIAFGTFVMEPETAGRVVVCLHIVLLAIAQLSLLRYTDRPKWYALLAVPIFYNYITAWGFLNYVLALPLALLAIVQWLYIVQGQRPRWRMGLFVSLSMAVAFTHVLVMLCLCAMVFVAALIKAFRETETGDVVSWLRRLFSKDVVVAGALLVPSVAYCLAAWFWARATSTSVWEHQAYDGRDVAAWYKLLNMVEHLAGNYTDESDSVFVNSVVLLAIVLVGVGGGRRVHPMMGMLSLLFFGAYIFIPQVFISTAYIYMRFMLFVLFLGIASLPRVDSWVSRVVGVVASVVALLATANHTYRFMTVPDMRDAMEIIDDAPAARTMAGIMYGVDVDGWKRPLLLHLPGIYQARKRGILMYSFLQNESPPVHYRPEKIPPSLPYGIEWSGKLFQFLKPYARGYDLYLVVNTTTSKQAPASSLFGWYEKDVKLISQRGRFWLYDATEANRSLNAKAKTKQ